MRRALPPLLFCVVASAACNGILGNDFIAVDNEGGSDASIDRADASTTPVTPDDASTDAPPPPDGGSDSATTIDASLDSGAGIRCGNQTCAIGKACCWSSQGEGKCQADCGINEIRYRCDDSLDCPGKLCCGNTQSSQGVSLVTEAKCDGTCDTPDVQLCASDLDCKPGSKCGDSVVTAPSGAKICR